MRVTPRLDTLRDAVQLENDATPRTPSIALAIAMIHLRTSISTSLFIRHIKVKIEELHRSNDRREHKIFYLFATVENTKYVLVRTITNMIIGFNGEMKTVVLTFKFV